MGKYNLALIPVKKEPEIIQYAQKFSLPAYSYRIGESSFPHITLCHFETEKENLRTIWGEALLMDHQPIHITFTALRCKTYALPLYGPTALYWISLIPDSKPQLQNSHLAIAGIIKNPQNAAFEHYDPHLTLFNSTDQRSTALNYSIKEPHLADDFTIALGESDSYGQLIKIIYTNDKTHLSK
jgi:hypothetical protein